MRSGRTVLVTGAGGGIGSMVVERFVAAGDHVVATDISSDALSSLSPRQDLRSLAGDVSSWEDCLRIAHEAQDWTGRIDVLVNCAGFFPLRSFEEMTAEEWRRVVDINLTGVFLVIKAALPLMKGHGWGRIINFGSGTFFKGAPDQAHYVSAKAGVIGLTRCLATELGDYGITANVITPGLTVTEAVTRSFSKGLIETIKGQRAIKRDQQPGDLVGAVYFLASPDADFITGQIINVDGGNVKH